jgi:mono/diheme cytochrome c family protein
MMLAGVRRYHWVIIIAALTSAALTSGAAQGQENIDQGKSGPKLFADTCAGCHRSARGLAKGRFSWTLSLYLQQHYTSSTATASALAAYLQSVDTPAAKSKVAKAKPSGKSQSPTTTGSIPSSLRPPAPTGR